MLTILRSRMFSRRAPMHPQKVMKNMTTPSTMRSTAWSMKNVPRTASVETPRTTANLSTDPHTSAVYSEVRNTHNTSHTCSFLNFGIYSNSYNEKRNTYKWKNKLHEIINCTFIIHKPQNGMVSVCVCVCVCGVCVCIYIQVITFWCPFQIKCTKVIVYTFAYQMQVKCLLMFQNGKIKWSCTCSMVIQRNRSIYAKTKQYIINIIVHSSCTYLNI